MYKEYKKYIENNGLECTNEMLELKDDGEGIYVSHWGYDIPQPTAEQLTACAIEVEAEERAVEYRRQRAQEYPTIEECIHALLDGGETYEALKEARAAIKLKYPKP